MYLCIYFLLFIIYIHSVYSGYIYNSLYRVFSGRNFSTDVGHSQLDVNQAVRGAQAYAAPEQQKESPHRVPNHPNVSQEGHHNQDLVVSNLRTQMGVS